MCHQIGKLKIIMCHLVPQNQDKYFFQSYLVLSTENEVEPWHSCLFSACTCRYIGQRIWHGIPYKIASYQIVSHPSNAIGKKKKKKS